MTQRDPRDKTLRASFPAVEASDELRVMLRPFSAYRALASGHPELDDASVWRRPVLTLLVLGCFVSTTTAGRFVPAHVLFVAIAWAFVPAAQLGSLAVVRALWGRHVGLRRTVHLFFAGQGGWLVALMGLMALVMLAPGVADGFDSGRWIVAIGLVALVALVHGMIVTFAFVREVWGAARGRALAATALYYLGVGGTFVTYYVVMGQLLPIVSSTA